MYLLQAKFLLANLADEVRMRTDDEDGAIPVEYLGILIFAAAVVVGIITSGAGDDIVSAVESAIDSVTSEQP